MLIIPAIDLIDGKCVRLQQGDYGKKTVYSSNPAEVAREFAQAGAELLHIVDLDGARAGHPQNLEVVKEIVRTVPIAIELGGGLRDLAAVEAAFAAGAARVVLGTAVLSEPDWFLEATARYSDRVVVGIDARDGKVAVHGWQTATDIPALDLALRMKELGINEIIYTDIARDGMLNGPNLDALKQLGRAQIKIVASGGVASLDDIRNLCRLAAYGVYAAIVGKALYTKQIELAEAIRVARS
ncbi:MAG: 1-(5-phosphoribosyl)-5-[(5-phosphoribosylamino)methylideneamino]imidazole-4-carboxamide isomerase [Firmicutes bacterium]|jgi:phosphoribosylformimino-5-aminoimidazole carboxamide ribotide isomerase|nr:1-(5-phosphoribosyl)-5-[(5-phosphoribosylamino)methylideneamino]imidazole-4-carboxamide isomerase [Bacillota bacterium]NLL89281.1 1-(5-phosphoribosyl)-5-[(5-phosphoribosylamino)methylideneamino]imidazole-4-carboxamide isomerase [Bacillota bacterium]HKM18159.1 1-(5-phosphoribosyl)-5-[(5-phosphoribosylamino)methylideneamino]imidazole-4-carboxamide isomerase [Limnochordia bacterium]